MIRNRPFLLEIQNTKWKNPIYEMTYLYTSPENIQNTKWKNPIYEMEKSNIRNEFIFNYTYQISNLRNYIDIFWKYAIYEMDKVLSYWFLKQFNLPNEPNLDCGFQKMSNLRNGKTTGMNFCKYPIYEMDQSYFVIFRKCAIYEMAKIQV